MKVLKRLTAVLVAGAMVLGMSDVYPEDMVRNAFMKVEAETTKIGYQWHLEPSVEAEDIIVSPSELTGVDLAQMKMSEIIELMGGEYSINSYIDGLYYIENSEVFPNISFCVRYDYWLDPLYDEYGESLLDIKLKNDEITLDAVELRNTSTATAYMITDTISSDYDYARCAEILGDFSCSISVDGWSGGSADAVAYSYKEDGCSITLHFCNESIFSYISSGKGASASVMWECNPPISAVVVEPLIEEPIDPFVQAHLNFIEENPDAFVNAEDVYVLAETKKLMYEYDSEITTYNGLKSFQNLIGGDMDIDTFNAELTSQVILTDLLCSQETLDAMDTAAQKETGAFLTQALDVFLTNKTNFNINEEHLAKLIVLCDTEDKTSAEFMQKRKEWLDEIVPSIDLSVLSIYFDATGKSGENLLLNLGEEAFETTEKYWDFCIAVRGYNAADACLRESLDKLLASLLVEYYMAQDGHDAESIRIKSVVDQFHKQYLSVINTADTKYDEYISDLVTRLATNTATQADAAITKELLLTAAKIACRTLGAVLEAMDLAFSIGMNAWEILSNVDERALERDMYLNMLVYYDAIVNAMNQEFKNTLVTEKTLDSAYIYEEGFGFYQKITAMMVEHGTQYYSMMYKNVSKAGCTEDEFHGMAEHIEGLLGTAYVEKMNTILEDQKNLWMSDEEIEAQLKLTLGYVKNNMMNEISNRMVSLGLFVDDVASMSCHESIVSSTPVAKPDFYVYDVACPINLTIKNGNTIVAEVAEDVLTMYDETTPVSVNLIKEEGDIYASKFVVVPSSYDVEITGYADGTMYFEKAVVENGLLTTISTITDIPVQNGSVYTEVIENNVTVALTCDLDGDGVTDKTLSAAVTENTLDLGDINSDGEVNASDAAMILVAAAAVGTGADSGLAVVQENAADIDHDGAFNAVDAASVLQYADAVGYGYTGTLEEFLAS